MEIKSAAQVASMKKGGRMLATTLDYLKGQVQAGVTTKQLANLASQKLQTLGGQPAFLGYQGFPGVICISVNDEVVHGIPSERILKKGDVVGLDFGVRYEDLVTDAAITVVVGDSQDDRVAGLVKATNEALMAGIRRVKADARVGDIGHAIEQRLRQNDLGVIETLVGHGVGKQIHEPPEIPNFGPEGQGTVLKAGMTLAIEPMATLGGKNVFLTDDGWTVKTEDGSVSAHFEHTVLVTEKGAEILTLP